MRRRWTILALVFAGTFAATHLLWAAGVGLALGIAALVTLVAGYGGRRRSRDHEYIADHAYYGAIGAAHVAGSYTSPADCSGGASSFSGDCGAGGV
jgi:hypothetical protein